MHKSRLIPPSTSKTIRIHNGSSMQIEKSVTRVTNCPASLSKPRDAEQLPE